MVTRSLSIHECLREVLKSLMNNNLDGDNLSEKTISFSSCITYLIGHTQSLFAHAAKIDVIIGNAFNLKF